ncbi:MAG: tRNA 2-thiouridine(34) synthase MnmA [Clostridia bacterium]|nr:tRNA 2-thiouridine(34) synthase MnmA [Clostridia bacterium]
MMKSSVLVGLSGGLDSTFAALSLMEDGYAVEGAVLSFSEHTDVKSAEKAASDLGIKLHIIDCRDDFKKFVTDTFVSEYLRGRTPNPCVVCNRYVKIKRLHDAARELGIDKFATGHYCSVGFEDGRYFIRRAADLKKDQSYMLWGLSQEQLSDFLTPLCDLSKEYIRSYMADRGFGQATAKESQDICFIPGGDYARYITEKIGQPAYGDFVDADGKFLGRHKGIIHYTIGQKNQLGIALGEKMAVSDINAEKNTVTLVKACDYLPAHSISVSDINFQYLKSLDIPKDLELTVKVRYSAEPRKTSLSFKNGKIYANFEPFFPDCAPGQSAVFYIGDKLAFGGFIEHAAR